MATAPSLVSPETHEFFRRLLNSPLYTSGAEGEDIDPQVRTDSLIAASEGLPSVEAFLQESGAIPGGISGNGAGGVFGAEEPLLNPNEAPPEDRAIIDAIMETLGVFNEGARNHLGQNEMARRQGTGRSLLDSVGGVAKDYLDAQAKASGGNKNTTGLDPDEAPPEDKAIIGAIMEAVDVFNKGAMAYLSQNEMAKRQGEGKPLLDYVGGVARDYLAAQAQASGGNKNRGLMDDYYDAQRAALGLPPVEEISYPDYKADPQEGLMAGWEDYKRKMLGSGMTIGEAYRDAGLEEPFIPIDNTEGGGGAGILPGKPTTQPDPVTQPEAYQAWIDSPMGKRYLAAQANATGGVANNPLPSARDIPNPDIANYIKTTIGSGAPGTPQEHWDALEFLQNMGLIDENGNFVGGGGEGTGDLTWTPPDYPFWDDIQAGQQTLLDILSGKAEIPYLKDLMDALELDIQDSEGDLEQSLYGRGIAGSTQGGYERSRLDTKNRGDRARIRMGSLLSYLPAAATLYSGLSNQGLGFRDQSMDEFTTLAGTDEALKTGAANRINQAMGSLWTGLGYTGAAPSVPNVNIPNTPSFGQNLGGLFTNLVMGTAQNPNFNPWSTWSNFWDNMGGGGGNSGGNSGGSSTSSTGNSGG